MHDRPPESPESTCLWNQQGAFVLKAFDTLRTLGSQHSASCGPCQPVAWPLESGGKHRKHGLESEVPRQCTFNWDVQRPRAIQPLKETKAIVCVWLIFLQEKDLVSVFDTWTQYVCVAAGMIQWILIAISGFSSSLNTPSLRIFAYKPLPWAGFRFGYLLSEIQEPSSSEEPST